jgi:hypothetical protein
VQKTYTHELVYDFDNEATISEIAASLIASKIPAMRKQIHRQALRRNLAVAERHVGLFPITEIHQDAEILGYRD